MKRIVRRAFTLIELLTVMAITALLMTIIVVPVFQSFNFTRSAQAFSDAQDRAQVVADRISRAIGNAVSVRNTAGLVQTYLNGKLTNVPAHSLIVVVPKRGSTSSLTAGTIEVVLPYVKMDLITAAEGDVSQTPGQFTNPTNGFVDPTMQSPKGQPALPAGPGATIIRYFVGLRDPLNPYNNPYDGILEGFNGGRDNLYVLYKAEVAPYVYRAGQGTNGDTSLKYRPNLTLFQSDFATDTQIVDLDDPRFFLNDFTANIGFGQPKLQRVQAWQAKAVLQTELSRYDMIQPVYDKVSHAVTYVGDAPVIVPLIQFRPSHVSNDAAQGMVAVREGEETNNAFTIGPDVYRTKYALWSNQIARVWPQGYAPIAGTNGGSQQYFVGRNDPSNGQAGAPPGYSIYYYDPAVSVTDYNSGQEVFDITTYEAIANAQGRYPFSQAITAANNRSNWLATQVLRDRFTPFDMNTAKGKLLFSFNISEVGDPTQAFNPNNPQNLPTVLTSPAGYGPYTPTQDPSYVPPVTSPNYVAGYIPGNFYDAGFQTINERFNWCYVDAPNLATQTDRFIDLRVTPMADGSVSPLHPTLGFAKCTIVPGSEVVYGPDQLPGPNLGNTIRYVRTTRSPGPNQYQINYVDQPEPRDAATQLGQLSGPVDYTLIGLTPGQVAGFNPAVYDPQNFCSAIIQPRYKKGYLKFNSDPNSPLPIGPIQVSYRFQFTGTQTVDATPAQTVPIPGGVSSSDVVAVDYDTRQLMSVLLTIRNYPQTTNIPNPQTVTVKATATVRNVIR
jgi:prepilin-type N-terminal cleavage/methylation domain-containing protein